MKALACSDSSTYTVNRWEKWPVFAVVLETLLMEEKRTVGIRREVVYCGRGGELKAGGPAFIYKYPCSCVLSCELCRNREEQGCVFRFKR